MTSQNLLDKQAKNYQNLSSEEQKEFLNTTYNEQNLGYAQIADMIGTYPNKVRRDAKKLGIPPRTRSEAQRLALESGRHKHPTKGTKRPDEIKNKIGQAVSDAYYNGGDKEKERRSEAAKRQWENMSDIDKENLHKMAAQAIRKTSVDGSKLERYLLEMLLGKGYKVQCHKEHLLKNDLLHIDLFLPELNIAIEVDGPAHLRKVWTEEAFEQKKNSDNNKTALLLSKGLVLIRVRQSGNLTRRFKTDVSTQLLETVDKIKNKFPDRKDRHIILGS